VNEKNFETLDRRDTLKLGAVAGLSALMTGMFPTNPSNAAENWFAPTPGATLGPTTGWNDFPKMLARIKAPTFPNRDFVVTDFGAVADGKTEATEAITKAIGACAGAGGGRVVIPKGEFLSGPIALKSGVNLHVSEGAVLKFVTDPAKFPVVRTRWEGIECMNFQALIYAHGQENIALTGKGTLDGQASTENWWAWKQSYFKQPGPDLQLADQKALIEMGNKGVPVEQRVFGQGHLLRPNFFQPFGCRNILVEDVSFIRSPMWELHPLCSSNITIRGVKISSHGPNNDGCDPESCWDVLIESCEFDTGDDCIAIKSGKNNDGRRVNISSENIIVRNCRMKDGHGGVVLGSECSGHIRNVFAENCDMDSPNLERVLRLKDNAVRGGILENVFLRDIRVGRVAEAILTIDLLYEEGAKGDFMPMVRNIAFDKVTANSAPRVMYIVDFPGSTIDDIRFSDCTFKGVESTEVVASSGTIRFKNVVIEPKDKPKSLSTRGAL